MYTIFPKGFGKWRSFLLVFILQFTPPYCNLLCLTALVSQRERGIMEASGHYTVIGDPMVAGL